VRGLNEPAVRADASFERVKWLRLVIILWINIVVGDRRKAEVDQRQRQIGSAMATLRKSAKNRWCIKAHRHPLCKAQAIEGAPLFVIDWK